MKGERRAQANLYDKYSGLVMGICFRYVRDEDLAKDVFQEAFMRIFEKLHQVGNEHALPGWIRQVTVSVALNHIRNEKFREQEDVGSQDLENGSYEDLLDQLSTEKILELIDQLPGGYRVVFNMYAIDGYSHKEIAKQLGISESTSRSQLVHARNTLKILLNEIGITRYERVV